MINPIIGSIELCPGAWHDDALWLGYSLDQVTTMQPNRNTIMVIGLTAILVAGFTASVPAAVYKYKKDGIWHFTDNPGHVPASQSRVIRYMPSATP